MSKLAKSDKPKRRSLPKSAREPVAENLKQDDLWAVSDRLRAEIGKVSGDSTTLIRNDRDQG